MESFHGPCQVLDLCELPLEIHAADLESFEITSGEIILLKTKNSLRGYETFRRDFVPVKLDATRFLIEKGVKTLGVDYLSVKKFGVMRRFMTPLSVPCPCSRD
ncbi:hypothetical protein GF325_02930 [Candidatus Bathyarchaeota archaeon]|nr:hypothetical protein [Candidatus Bathyarchaeota archaeon]